MFLGQSAKPDVDGIDGLSPAISIDQKTTNHNPRSTVGTVTEIYDYVRLLYARVGVPMCPNGHGEISKQNIDQIIDKILGLPESSKIMVEAPVVRGKKGTYEKLLEGFRKSGYARVEIDGTVYSLDENLELDKNKKHNISVVVDRLIIKDDIRSRLTESVEIALKLAEGILLITNVETSEQKLYSTNFSCPICGYTLGEITPRLFSFNSPFGACPECTGLGYTEDIDEDLVLKNSNLSIKEGAFNVTGWSGSTGTMASMYFNMLSKTYGIDLNKPVCELPREQLDIILYGNGGKKVEMEMQSARFSGQVNSSFEGIINNLSRRYKESSSEFIRFEISKFIKEQKCRLCQGKRLSENAIAVKINGLDITEFCNMSVEKLKDYVDSLKFNETELKICESILKEIKARLQFLLDVGLGYLTLNRSAESLSGGESQRIRLATQIGSGLMGVVYILDEPTTGLHSYDVKKLISILQRLVDSGNTVVVIEHNLDVIKSVDYIIDLGPEGGDKGGQVIASGTPEEVSNFKDSYTGMYLKKYLNLGDEK